MKIKIVMSNGREYILDKEFSSKTFEEVLANEMRGDQLVISNGVKISLRMTHIASFEQIE